MENDKTKEYLIIGAVGLGVVLLYFMAQGGGVGGGSNAAFASAAASEQAAQDQLVATQSTNATNALVSLTALEDQYKTAELNASTAITEAGITSSTEEALASTYANLGAIQARNQTAQVNAETTAGVTINRQNVQGNIFGDISNFLSGAISAITKLFSTSPPSSAGSGGYSLPPVSFGSAG